MLPRKNGVQGGPGLPTIPGDRHSSKDPAIVTDASREALGLMARMASSDQAALARLITLYGRGMRIVATRYIGDAAAAEDIVQEAFLRAWTEARRFDPARGSAAAWLYRIAINLCIDQQRRRRLVRFFGLDGEADVTETDDPGAEQIVQGRQNLARVRRQIAALPGPQRMAILLSAVAGMDGAEIAATMDRSRGSVEQLLVRARRTLRLGLEGEVDDG